jgi:hypothetical protein
MKICGCSKTRAPRSGRQNLCDQKLASDSSGLSGGFSGQRAWVRKIKKWAPGSYCFELVVKLVQLPGQVLSAPLYFGDRTEIKELNPLELNKWVYSILGPTVQEMRCAYLSVHWSVELVNVTLRNSV